MALDKSLKNPQKRTSSKGSLSVPSWFPCSGMGQNLKLCPHVKYFAQKDGWHKMLNEIEDPASEGCCYLFSPLDALSGTGGEFSPLSDQDIPTYCGSVTLSEKTVRTVEIRMSEAFAGSVSLDVHLGFQASLGILVRGTVGKSVTLIIRSFQKYPESRFVCKEKLVCLHSGIIEGKTFGKVYKSALRCSCEYDVKVLQPTNGGIVRLEPHLEADGKEIEAVHGCSVGRIPADALLYLESRGVTRDVAEKMYFEGFLR